MALGDQFNALDTAIKLNPKVLGFALTGITMVGLIFGCIEVFVLSRMFKGKKFLTKLFFKSLIYLVFFFVVILITFPFAAGYELQTTPLDPRVWQKYQRFFFSITHLSAALQLAFSVFVSLLYVEISDNLGQSVLLNFFTGKYHQPKMEERIFMFLDMKDSTTIAEALGHVNYFKFFQSYYNAFSNAIIKNRGEVYQYIGDEIVITWTLSKGIKSNHCVHCFFDMKKDLLALENSFKKKFQVVLDFKAALHVGEVTTGEIGALKKDIFFTGDVLNTTARILGLSTSLKEDLLISAQLKEKLEDPM